MFNIKNSLKYLCVSIALISSCKKDSDDTTPAADVLPTVVLINNSWSIGNTLFTGNNSTINWVDSSGKSHIVATQATKSRISVKFSAGIGDPPAGNYKVVLNSKILSTDEVAVVLDVLKSDGTVDTSYSSTNTSKTVQVTSTTDTMTIVLTNATLSEKTGKKAYVSAKIKIENRKINYANWTIGTEKYGSNNSNVFFNSSYPQVDCEVAGSFSKMLRVIFDEFYTLGAGTFPIEKHTGNHASSGKVGIYVVANYVSSYESTSSSGGTVVVSKETGKTKIKITNVTVTPFGAANQILNGEIVLLD